MSNNSIFTFTDLYITNKKEQIFQRIEGQITMYSTLIDILKDVENVLPTFDNKVFNVRFFNKINSEIIQKYKKFYAKMTSYNFLEFHYKGKILEGNIDYIIIKLNDNRISAGETEKVIAEKIDALKKSIEKMEDYKTNFDKYTEETKKMEIEIMNYMKNVPYMFQLDIIVNKPHIDN